MKENEKNNSYDEIIEEATDVVVGTETIAGIPDKENHHIQDGTVTANKSKVDTNESLNDQLNSTTSEQSEKPTSNTTVSSSNVNNEYEKNILDEHKVDHWNTGAFASPFFWGIANKVPMAYVPTIIATVLLIIPILNLLSLIFIFGWSIYAGFKGNTWAWKTTEFNDTDNFLKSQKTWNRFGIAWVVIYIIGFLLFMIMGFTLLSFLSNLSGGMTNY